MLSKKSQLLKNRQPNPKKLSKEDNRSFIDTIHSISDKKCQLCGDAGQDIHHPYWGKMGADRDTTIALLVCRQCHSICHLDKHGEYNLEAQRVGEANKMEYITQCVTATQ